MSEPEEKESFDPNGIVTGLLELKSRPGTPDGATREFETFTALNIIIAASDWTVSGFAKTAGGERQSYSLFIYERDNRMELQLGSLMFVANWPDREVTVVNDAPERRLTVRIDRPLFAANDPARFLNLPSVFHAERNP